jgi:hypothetical protein
VFHSRVWGIIFYSIFFLPGILIHELSHFFAAQLLNVRTGNINIFPQEIKGENVLMGSVQSEHTDPFREILIGAAPFFTGLFVISFITMINFSAVFGGVNNSWEALTHLSFLNIFFLYLIFSIGNTMFISKEDQRGLWFLPLILIAIVSLISAFEVKVNYMKIVYEIDLFLNIINKALFLCLFLDVVSLIFLKFILILINGLTKRCLS